MSVMIQTHNLTKQYGNVNAVNDVSITIESGAIVGLVGRNGAGKTTLIRLLTGLCKPTSGSFEIMPNQQRLDTSVAAIVERPSVYTNMTAMENLTAQSILLGLPVDEPYLQSTLELVGLAPLPKKKVRDYSLGMRQRLALAMTLVGKPQLLILDEPTNGLDPQGIHDMRELFIKLNKQFGTTLVVSSHILTELGKFANEFYFMERGAIIKHATAQEIEAHSQKRLHVTVDDTQKAIQVLTNVMPQPNTFEVVEVAPNTIEIYADIPSTQVILTLAQNGVTASNVVNIGDDLESYYISLVNGGSKNA